MDTMLLLGILEQLAGIPGVLSKKAEETPGFQPKAVALGTLPLGKENEFIQSHPREGLPQADLGLGGSQGTVLLLP